VRKLSLKGRANRKEFWAIFAPVLVWNLALIWMLEVIAPTGIHSLIPALACLVFLIMAPDWLGLAVIVRRLHDIGRSAIWIVVAGVAARLAQAVYKGLAEGWPHMLLVGLCVTLAGVAVLYLGLTPGTPTTNEYGPDPLRSGQLGREA
jgi:uncharacterized membrane protein YhaH (DUF805 family)